LVASDGTSAATVTVSEGVVGPPKTGSDTCTVNTAKNQDCSIVKGNPGYSGDAATDAASFPCPPTAAQIAMGYSCVIMYGNDGNNDTGTSPSDGANRINVPIVFSGQTLTTPNVTLALSLSSLTYGSEQSEKISATVKPAISSGIVVPTIVVKSGLVTACTINLTTESNAYMASSTGSCTLAPSVLNAGTNSLVGNFSAGAVNYNNTTTKPYSVVVKKVTSKTTLKALLAKITYGKEQTEKLTATVSPIYSSGTVSIKFGTTTLCKLTLVTNTSKVSCNLTAKQLKIGSDKLSAIYSGNTNVVSSTSYPVTITVKKS
jgi:hypothetical protein